MAPVFFRAYTAQPGFTRDFQRVRDFLLRQNHERLRFPNFPWGRWEWIFCRSHQDRTALNRIGLWEAAGEIVALATYEDQLGDTFFVVDAAHADLKQAMFDHAETHLAGGAHFHPIIDDDDAPLQRIAHARGYVATQETQPTSILHPDSNLAWHLPDGFRLASIADEFDVRRYNRCLHRGFNHQGEPDDSESALAQRWQEVSGPHQNRACDHVVIAPNGDYASFCGMWYQHGEYAALVEPVCTDPTYRRMGCGRAAVLASAKACFDAGAQVVMVGSSQQFYYDTGFAPAWNAHAWERVGE